MFPSPYHNYLNTIGTRDTLPLAHLTPQPPYYTLTLPLPHPSYHTLTTTLPCLYHTLTLPIVLPSYTYKVSVWYKHGKVVVRVWYDGRGRGKVRV